MSELKYWVWLSTRLGVRARMKLELLEHFSGVRALYFASEADYRAAAKLTGEELRALGDKELDGANRALGLCDELDVQIITIRDAAYPQRLKQIYDPPVALYVRGRLPELDDRASVAVVGTRRATPYGERMASKLGYEITKCGGIVISGMTAGIDAASAVGALRADGACIGVTGAHLDGAFGGAGLSVAAVVVEAPEKSGALLFADEAAAQGREVFAVPGNADAANSYGTNALLKDGARPATCAWDILGDFAQLYPGTLRRYDADARQEPQPLPPEDRRETGETFAQLRAPISQKVIDKEKREEYIDLQQQLSALSETQLKIIAAMDAPQLHVDDIIEKARLPAPTVLAELTVLQIQGYVTQEAGKRFSLNVRPTAIQGK